MLIAARVCVYDLIMSLLRQTILEKLRSEGPMNFETFMEMALYYPGLGYYAKDEAVIGRAGDFYTSPHLHKVFGAMLAKQMVEMWDLTGRPNAFNIVEMGAGMGYLAKDMLEYLSASGDKRWASSVRYTIVERNPSVMARQRELLSEFADKVRWVSSLDELDTFKGCVISNELLDAFPVRMIETDDGLKEIYVAVEGDELVEVKRPCSNEVLGYLKELSIELPDRYRTEVNLQIKGWIEKVSDKLAEGFVLTVDYGYPAWDYYSEDRNRGTLLCYHRHRINENPYLNVGEQDLTAHINFSSLKKWGEEVGLKAIGFCPQGTYLVSLGLDEIIKELYGEAPDPFEIAKIKGLFMPQGMGESHKVMVQYKGAGTPDLKGFKLRNQLNRL